MPVHEYGECSQATVARYPRATWRPHQRYRMPDVELCVEDIGAIGGDPAAQRLEAQAGARREVQIQTVSAPP